MSFGKALYFPYIHFQDENWLKYTLLYWDGVKRIVPSTYKPQDSESVKALAAEGLVESVDPHQYTASAAKEFIPTLKELMRKRPHPSRGVEVGRQIEGNAGNASVHIQKMDQQVARMLEQSGLAKQSGDWYAMDSGLAGYYMLCLAAHISEKQKAPMLSDSVAMETGGTYFQHSRLAGSIASQGRDVGFTLARMVLPVPRPENLAAVPMKEILKFHRKYEAERMQFRAAIEKVTKDAAGLNDKSAIRDLLQQQKKVIANAMRDQEKALDEFGVGTAMSLMAVSAPGGAIVGALSNFDPVITSVATGVTLALSFVGWIAKTRQEKRKAIRSSDWHYLLRLDKAFDTRTVANEVGNSFRGFILD